MSRPCVTNGWMQAKRGRVTSKLAVVGILVAGDVAAAGGTWALAVVMAIVGYRNRNASVL